MPHYKDASNTLHFLDDTKYEGLLPPGCVQIKDEEAEALRQPTDEQLARQAKDAAMSQAQALEAKQARTIREALLSGDKARLLEIEKQIAELMGREPVV